MHSREISQRGFHHVPLPISPSSPVFSPFGPFFRQLSALRRCDLVPALVSFHWKFSGIAVDYEVGNGGESAAQNRW